MNNASELISGVVIGAVADLWILQNRNRGIKQVRAKDSVRRRFADHMTTEGKAQIYRPRKSPTLNMRKWIALKRSGCVLGLVGCIEAVIGGKTAYWKSS